MGGMIYAYKFTGEKPEGRISFWRPRRGLMGTAYVTHNEITYEDVNWIHLTQESIHRRGTSEYVSLIKLGFRKKGEKIKKFKICATISIL
jgi:hypothetical protein